MLAYSGHKSILCPSLFNFIPRTLRKPSSQVSITRAEASNAARVVLFSSHGMALSKSHPISHCLFDKERQIIAPLLASQKHGLAKESARLVTISHT